MFIKFVEFPPIKEGKEQDVKDWFKESNAIFSKFDGFISLRLLVSAKGSYAGLLEHQSKETFLKMHNSKEQAEWQAKAATMFDGAPKPSLFEVVEL
ncbi:MAG: antibiotic biosynthesis monooxygenase family protein [Halobacteriota archaeon]